jgi:hypothetical protein
MIKLKIQMTPQRTEYGTFQLMPQMCTLLTAVTVLVPAGTLSVRKHLEMKIAISQHIITYSGRKRLNISAKND